MLRPRARLAAVSAAVASTALVIAACSVQSSSTAGGSAGTTPKALKVGWSDIYLTPSWMQETQQLIDADAASLKTAGKISSFQIFNANGDTTQQISQIQAMIQQHYNVILVDAGSSTALNPVLDQAVTQGITVVNFDSLVTSTEVVRVDTDQTQWGSMLAQWLATKIGGRGDIIAFNGPAGVAVSDDRWAGAESVFKRYPGIKVVANLNSEYNLAPAEQAFASAYSAHPGIVGIFSQGGALSDAALQTIVNQHGKLIPITGENYNGFLTLWQREMPHGFSGLATAQPNYLANIALEAGVAKAEGKTVPQYINVPLPVINDSNLSQWAKPSESSEDYPIQTIPDSEINQLIGLG
jgi:ribose transport system substrate-binding protein